MNIIKTIQTLKKKFHFYFITFIIAGSAIVFLTNCSSTGSKTADEKSDISAKEKVIVSTTPIKNAETPKAENTKIGTVTDLTDKDFKSTIIKGVVLVDFWASWCGPCRMQGPIIDQLAKEMGDKVKFTKLNVDANNKTSSDFNVKNIPTIIIFKNGKQVLRFVGLQEKAFLKSQLEGIL